MKLSGIHILALLFTYAFVLSCKDDEQAASAGQQPAERKDSVSVAGIKHISFNQDQYNLADIQIGAIESRNLSNIIKLTGVVESEPGSEAFVSAPLGGYVRTPGLIPGQQVKKGELLITLENPEFITLQQQYLESVGQMEYLEAEFKRQEILRQENVNAEKTFQQVKAEYKVMKSKILGLEQQLALININSAELKKSNKISRTSNLYAPISGSIRKNNVHLGQYVSPTDVLFEIIGYEELHLSLNAFEKDVTKIKPGQAVKFSLANEDTYNRTAEVFLIGRSVDDKITPIHCHLKDMTGLLHGMYVKAWVELGKEEENTVPSDAVVQFNGLDYIVIQTDETNGNYTFQLLQVLKHIEQEGYTAIELPKNADPKQLKVVVKNAYTILSAIRNSEEGGEE